MLCEHDSVFRLSDFDDSQWITFAIVNLLLILFVKIGLPLIRSFMRESRLLDEDMSLRFRKFYHAKFGPHFLARNSSPETVLGIFIYSGLGSRWLFECTLLSNLCFAAAALTLAMWKLDLVRLHFSNLLRFVEQNGPSNPTDDAFTGMPQFQPDLMAETRQSWNIAPDSASHHGSQDSTSSLRRVPASSVSPEYKPGSSIRVN